jgi:hypothetical protein
MSYNQMTTVQSTANYNNTQESKMSKSIAISNYVHAYESGEYPVATNQTESQLYAQINQARATMNDNDFSDYLYELDFQYNSFE